MFTYLGDRPTEHHDGAICKADRTHQCYWVVSLGFRLPASREMARSFRTHLKGGKNVYIDSDHGPLQKFVASAGFVLLYAGTAFVAEN